MEDEAIVGLFWARDDGAIGAAADKYGGYCGSIAANILGSGEDAEECVNDTWLRAWDAMPTARPARLGPFLGKLVRNLAIDRRKHDRAAKRGGGELPLVLSELAECVSGREDVEGEIDRRELAAAIDGWLRSLAPEKRRIFLRRYWYAQSVKEIAAGCGMSPARAAKILERARKGLRAYLTGRGFEV